MSIALTSNFTWRLDFETATNAGNAPIYELAPGIQIYVPTYICSYLSNDLLSLYISKYYRYFSNNCIRLAPLG